MQVASTFTTDWETLASRFTPWCKNMTQANAPCTDSAPAASFMSRLLTDTKTAMLQGSNRVQRATNFYSHLRKTFSAAGFPAFQPRWIVIPDSGHTIDANYYTSGDFLIPK